MTTAFKWFFLGICLMQSYSTAFADIIHHNKIEAPKDAYQLGLLKLALSYSSIRYEYSESPDPLTQGKLMADLDTGTIDVAWVGAAANLEESHLPIRVPLFKGLLGHRIFLIRKGEQARFNNIKTINDLSTLKAGQGADWVDAKVLENAGLPVVRTAKFNGLFNMLDGGRFDYFPRSIYSPWGEMATKPNLALDVEENLLIVYPLPAYFFVAKNNVKLATEIEKGLFNAIEDGSFDKFFYSHPMIKDGLEKGNLSTRTVIRLTNPYLSTKTPLDDKRLWFDVADYLKKQASVEAPTDTLQINNNENEQ